MLFSVLAVTLQFVAKFTVLFWYHSTQLEIASQILGILIGFIILLIRLIIIFRQTGNGTVWCGACTNAFWCCAFSPPAPSFSPSASPSAPRRFANSPFRTLKYNTIQYNTNTLQKHIYTLFTHFWYKIANDHFLKCKKQKVNK